MGRQCKDHNQWATFSYTVKLREGSSPARYLHSTVTQIAKICRYYLLKRKVHFGFDLHSFLGGEETDIIKTSFEKQFI